MKRWVIASWEMNPNTSRLPMQTFKKILSCLIWCACFFNAGVNAQNGGQRTGNGQALSVVSSSVLSVEQGYLVCVTSPVSDMSSNSRIYAGETVRNEFGPISSLKKGIEKGFEYFEDQQQLYDPLSSKGLPPASQKSISSNVEVSFDGMGFSDSGSNPGDPTLAVGPNHIIQMVNGTSGSYFKIFNKSGIELVPKTYLDAITGRGGFADPIVLYDQLEDRFIMTELVNNTENNNTFGFTMAVSVTNDPTGSWYVYYFPYVHLPDYPKFSVWTDAYYLTTNDYIPSWHGTSVWAINKAALLSGQANPSFQRIVVGTTQKYFGMCPVTLEGNTLPPTGMGGLFAYMFDDAWTSSTADKDSISVLEFKVNFSNPALTTVSTIASLEVAAFKSDICSADRGACISQPGSSIQLEALHQKVMNQPVYRNFGDHQSIALVHVVDKGNNISALRWYELRTSVAGWEEYQQGTFSLDDTHRFMPSIAMNGEGGIALAYNVSSSVTGVYSGLRYAWRKTCDPLGTMSSQETVIIAGSAASNTGRYGDYNHLVSDPNGNDFWFTGQYNTSLNWRTKIICFNIEGGAPPSGCEIPASLSVGSVTSDGGLASWSQVNGVSGYDLDIRLASSTTWTNVFSNQNVLSFALSGLLPSASYQVRVRAICEADQSGYRTVTFETLPLICTFQESNGAVVVEAENYSELIAQGDPLSWQSAGVLGVASGSYMMTPDNGTANRSFTNGSKLRYHIQINTSGTYKMFVRRYAAGGGANSINWGLDNIVRSGTDNGGAYNQWVWIQLGSVAVTAGAHTLELARREDGYAIDRIVFTTGNAPTGVGLAQSNCGSGNNNCTLTVSIAAVSPECHGANSGSALATASGGAAPVSYVWNNGSSSASIQNLPAGAYTVTATDANGCTAEAGATLSAPPALSLVVASVNESIPGSNNGSASATASGGTPPYAYQWSNGATTAAINNLAPGTYTVTATDGNACTTTGSVQVLPASSSSAYRYLRATVSATNDGNRLRINDFGVVAQGVTHSISNGLWDNSGSGFPQVKTKDLGAGNGIAGVDNVMIYTVFNTSRAPRSFTIEGADSPSGPWTLLCNRSNLPASIFTPNAVNYLSCNSQNLMGSDSGMQFPILESPCKNAGQVGVVLFPNPVMDVLSIRIEGEIPPFKSARIYSATGAEVWRFDANETIDFMSINVSDQVPGIYRLVLMDEQGRVTAHRSFVLIR